MPPQPSATGPHSPLSQVFLQSSPPLVSIDRPPVLPVFNGSPSAPLAAPLPAVSF
jgi:hypothetical protein